MRKDTVAELRLLGFWAVAQNEPGRGAGCGVRLGSNSMLLGQGGAAMIPRKDRRRGTAKE